MKTNPLAAIPISLTAPRFIGKHKGCGGSVFYHSSRTFAFRRCSECGQDGMRGTVSPSLENE